MKISKLLIIKEFKSFAPILLILFAVRWSLVDHYRVISGSMKPTIKVGDQVFVNKMAYQLKIPFTNQVIMETGSPQRGDIIIFKYPLDPSQNFVKRLIGLPGDKIEITDGLITVNGQSDLKFPFKKDEYREKLYSYSPPFLYQEILGSTSFDVQRVPLQSRPHEIKFTVPTGKYFFMGDNRDLSADSRLWGFVEKKDFKGKIGAVTLSFDWSKGLFPRPRLERFGKKLAGTRI